MTTHRQPPAFVTASVTVLAVGLTTLAGCGDDDAHTPEELSAELSVVVTHPDHPTIEYQVSCDGLDASITGDETGVDATAACRSLTDEAAFDRLMLGVPTGRVCAEVFGGPDVATISGVIDEVPVATVVDRTNACMIEDWDEVLGGLLPQARGQGAEIDVDETGVRAARASA